MSCLKGKVAIVTGGNGGFGRETARLLAQNGADILICGRNEATLEEARADIAQAGTKVVAVKCDVGVEEEVEHLFAVLDEELGRLDILVNNAGLSRSIHVEKHDSATWHELMAANLDSAFFCCRAAAQRMLKQGDGGAIVNLGSIAGMTNRDVSVAYAASKAGIVGLTRCLAGQLAPEGIRVNAICPGPIPTPVFRDFDKATQERLMSTIKLNRWGSATDIANLVLFLVGDEGSWITGEAININGGAFMG